MQIIIDEKYAGITIKKLLFDELVFSRSAITALKKRDDGILVNGEHKTVRYILNKGDELFLGINDISSSPRINACKGDIDIIYEDEHIIAVNKPGDLAVHPSKKIQDDTLAGRILYHRAPMVFRAMGRLDKNTSGIVVCSKDQMTSAMLYRLISQRKVQKEYILIAKGAKAENIGEINFGIIRDRESYIKRICIPESEAAISEKALTKYRIIAEKDDYKLILASPITGRTHQLRAHFSHIGNPIIGDTLYGSGSEYIERQALHAYRLKFFYPHISKEIILTAPLFPDMESAIEEIFGEKFEEILKNSDIKEEKLFTNQT